MLGRGVSRGSLLMSRCLKHMFRSPPPIYSALCMLVVSLGFAFLTSRVPIVFFSLLFLPAILSGFFSKPLAEVLGGDLPLRRSMLLSFLCLIVVAVLGTFSGLLGLDVFIFAFASIVWLRYLVLASTSEHSIRSLPPAILHSFFGFLMLAFCTPLTPTQFFLAIALTGIFFLTCWVLVTAIDTSVKKEINVPGLELLKHTLFHLSNEKRGLESCFEAFAESVDVDLGILSFKKKNDKVKALMLIPTVHAGPFGNVGGSDLPIKLATQLRDISEHILVAHGACTHDFNPINALQCKKLATAAKECIERLSYSPEVSKLIRQKATVEVGAQMFGKNALVVHSSDADDVGFSVGYAASSIAAKYADQVVFVDAHNLAVRNAPSIYMGSPRAFETISLAEKCVKLCRNKGGGGVEVGVATRKPDIFGIGKAGINCVVVKAGAQKSAYLLWDGNNMVPAVKEKMENELRTLVDEPLILTTDNHAVNLSPQGFNPIGTVNETKLIALAREVVEDAINNLEPAEVGVGKTRIHGLLVMGQGSTTRLATLTNSVLNMLKSYLWIDLALAVLAGVLLCFML